jgi:uncharacterized membrane protein
MFISGALFLAPVVITYLVLRFIFLWLDDVVKPVERFLLGVEFTGLGVLLLIVLLYVAGLLVAYVLAPGGLRFFRPLFRQLPGLREMYSMVERIVDFAVSPKLESFSKVVVVEFPWDNRYTFAFDTGRTKVQGDLVYRNIYIPTPMTVQSGMFALVPEDKVFETNMRVEECMGLVLSAGLSYPPHITIAPRPVSGGPAR